MSARVRTCAVIQGNVRRGTREIVDFAAGTFDRVVLSTWEGEDVRAYDNATCHVILNKKPPNPGYSNRNFQRLSASAGISYAESLGCTHVLKWRTDMLPTKLSLRDMLAWAHYRVPNEVSSRIVTCAFRNLTVREDWFSSIPDLFAFGDLEMMKLLWGAESFDFSQPLTVPAAMRAEAGDNWTSQPDTLTVYCAETELYAWFRARLEERVGGRLSHCQIAKNYMYLIDHKVLEICWFDDSGGFRPITQALQHPWWTHRVWKYGRPTVSERGYPEGRFMQRIKRKFLTPAAQKINLKRQSKWYRQYVLTKHPSA